jgi:hypothetical protein
MRCIPHDAMQRNGQLHKHFPAPCALDEANRVAAYCNAHALCACGTRISPVGWQLLPQQPHIRHADAAGGMDMANGRRRPPIRSAPSRGCHTAGANDQGRVGVPLVCQCSHVRCGIVPFRPPCNLSINATSFNVSLASSTPSQR